MKDVTAAWLALDRQPGGQPDQQPDGQPEERGNAWAPYRRAVVKPLARLLAGGKLHIVGMAGPPGCGKSTLARLVAEELPRLRILSVSLDDFYLPRTVREARGLAWRGPPGSHDLDSLLEVLEAVRTKRAPFTLPRFSHETDDRLDPTSVNEIPDVLILEGWYVGYQGDGYGAVLPYLDLLVYLDLDVETSRSRRFEREAALQRQGAGFGPQQMTAFWDEVLGPGVETWGAEARRSADLILHLSPRGDVRSVETSNDLVLEALSG